MSKSGVFSILVATSIAAVTAAGCSCSDKGGSAAPAETVAQPAAPAPAQEEKKKESIIPSVTDRKMALQLGHQFMMQGKIEEAEEKYRIAAAGGDPEAEKMLLKIQTEKDAKRLMESANSKIDLGDYDGAKLDLERVARGNSVQKAKAEKLLRTISERKAARERAMEENLRKGMEKAFAAAEEEEPAAEEEAASGAEAAAEQGSNESASADSKADEEPSKDEPQKDEPAPSAAPAAEEPAAEPAAEEAAAE